MNNPLLSICIPTFNRAIYLEDTILSIIKQRRFQETNEVEIVISDNCSEDNSYEVCEKFIAIFGDKVHYYRNSENIKDENFEKVLSYGKGVYLKLNNDTLKHQEGSLDKMLQTIVQNEVEKNIIFFSNGLLNINHSSKCNNLNSFVDIVSFYSGWIAAFGIWREDFITFNDFSRCSNLQLTQVDVLFRLINSNKSVIVYNETLFISIPPLKKGGYDLLTVFLDNYLFLLTEQLNNHKIKRETFESEKKKLLLKFICSWLVHARVNPEVNYFEQNNTFQRIFYYYKKNTGTIIKFLLYYYLSFYYNFAKKIINCIVNKNERLK